MRTRLHTCRPDLHVWHVRTVLVLGLAGVDGWYPLLLERQCGICGGIESFIGQQNSRLQRIRLLEGAQV